MYLGLQLNIVNIKLYLQLFEVVFSYLVKFPT